MNKIQNNSWIIIQNKTEETSDSMMKIGKKTTDTTVKMVKSTIDTIENNKRILNQISNTLKLIATLTVKMRASTRSKTNTCKMPPNIMVVDMDTVVVDIAMVSNFVGTFF